MACQLGPGFGLTGPPPIKVFPLISQIETWPVLVFWKKDVGKAVAIEVARSDCLPGRPWIGTDRPAADQAVPAHFPDRDLAAARILPQDVVGKAVVSEIAGSDRFPGRPGIGCHRAAADQAVPVHLPDRGLAGAGVLPQNVGIAVTGEVACSDLGPTRSGIGVHGPAVDQGGPVHFPDCGLAVRILPQEGGESGQIGGRQRDRVRAADLSKRAQSIGAARTQHRAPFQVRQGECRDPVSAIGGAQESE